MDIYILTLIAVVIAFSTAVQAIKAYLRHDWGIAGTLLPRFFLLGIILSDIITPIDFPVYLYHLGIASVLLGDMIANIFIIFNKRFKLETYSLLLLGTLKDLQVKFDFIVDHVPVGIYVLGPTGRFEFVNKAFSMLTGYPVEYLVHSKADILVPFRNKATVAKSILEKLEGKVEESFYDTELLTSSGREIKVTVSSKRTLNGHTTITGCIIPLKEE